MGYRAGQPFSTFGVDYAAGDVIPDASSFPGLIDAVIAGVIVPESVEDIPGIVPEIVVHARMAEVAVYLRDHDLPVPAGMAAMAGLAEGTYTPAGPTAEAPQSPSEAPESAGTAGEAPVAPKAPRTRKAAAKPKPITTEAPDPEA